MGGLRGGVWGGSQITKCDFNTTDKRHICQDKLSQEDGHR